MGIVLNSCNNFYNISFIPFTLIILAARYYTAMTNISHRSFLNFNINVCALIQKTVKNKSRKATQVITGPMHMYSSGNWALNRSERRKFETARI
jgi:hypothetical protein